MKEQYEHRTRYMLPRRTYTVIRVDGKAFHSLTRGCGRPFDKHFMAAMTAVGQRLCTGIQGACLAYVQSDEVSVLLQDFAEITTDAWFDGNVQKMASVSAAMATASFTAAWGTVGLFDSRVFTIPDSVEVENYFIWRQQDATRNSIQMAGHALFSDRELHKKSTADIQDMLHARGINWNDYPVPCKRGTVIRRVVVSDEPLRTAWLADHETPIFTKERAYLSALVSRMHGEVTACNA